MTSAEIPHKHLAPSNVSLATVDLKSYSHTGYLVRDEEYQAYTLVMSHSRQSSMSSNNSQSHQVRQHTNQSQPWVSSTVQLD
ncbi:hypothetical protein EB796_003307 [Bugula neritina]|uniref:Uncharacterized protein n=1 Tax=Bugula neritina TaxID=10212 RepID=A0A7J7KKI5_BUGNE|nr:hypothetical protein EB796_003307 [Bugula neritina]